MEMIAFVSMAAGIVALLIAVVYGMYQARRRRQIFEAYVAMQRFYHDELVDTVQAADRSLNAD